MTDESGNDIFGLREAAAARVELEAEAAWLSTHFLLTHNPFPPSGISPDAPDGPPLRDEHGGEIAPRIGRFIRTAFGNRSSTQGLVIIGAYGTGKSHLLRLMHHQINERLGAGDDKALSIYVDRPRLEAQDLNRGILKSLGEDTVRKMLWFCVRSEIAQDIDSQSEHLKSLQRQLQGTIFASGEDPAGNRTLHPVFDTENLADHRRFLEACDSQGWNRQLLRDYFVGLYQRSLDPESPLEVIDAFVALLLAKDHTSRETWESLLALGKRRKVPLMSAPEFLEDLLRMTRINGYAYTFLLIDEFEEVPAGYLLTRRQKADYMYTLMEMLNRVQVGLGLVLAITPEAWNRLTEEAPPLSDRLPTVIRLGALDAESLTRLYAFYLERARTRTKPDDHGPLFPLSQKVVSQITAGLPDPTPRNALQFGYQLLSHCAEHGIETVSPEVVEAALEEFRSMKSADTQKRTVKGR